MLTRKINIDLLLQLKQHRESDIISALIQQSLSSNNTYMHITESVSFDIARQYIDFFNHDFSNAYANMPVIVSDEPVQFKAFPAVPTHYSETELHEQPSLATQLKTFTTSTVNWVTSGMPFASSELLSTRMETCKSCDQWDSSAFAGTGKCKICGCSTSLKLRMTTEKCPIGKW